MGKIGCSRSISWHTRRQVGEFQHQGRVGVVAQSVQLLAERGLDRWRFPDRCEQPGKGEGHGIDGRDHQGQDLILNLGFSQRLAVFITRGRQIIEQVGLAVGSLGRSAVFDLARDQVAKPGLQTIEIPPWLPGSLVSPDLQLEPLDDKLTGELARSKDDLREYAQGKFMHERTHRQRLIDGPALEHLAGDGAYLSGVLDHALAAERPCHHAFDLAVSLARLARTMRDRPSQSGSSR